MSPLRRTVVAVILLNWGCLPGIRLAQAQPSPARPSQTQPGQTQPGQTGRAVSAQNAGTPKPSPEPTSAKPSPEKASAAAAQPASIKADGAKPDASAPAATPAASSPASQNPHAKVPTRNSTVDAEDLPAGNLEVVLLDANGAPLPGKSVQLMLKKSSIEQGDSQSTQMQLSDGDGKARFSDLSSLSDFSYRVVLKEGEAQFASPVFQMREGLGKRQTLFVFPVVRDFKAGLIVSRGVIAIHPRDDVFVVEFLVQLQNVGKSAWVPDGFVLELPAGYTAFTAQESEADTRFEEKPGVGAELKGTFPPGVAEANFRFHLPNPHKATYSVELPMFPQSRDMRVIVDASNEMTLRVSALDPATSDRMPRTGQKVLVAGRDFIERQETSPKSLLVTIGGLRTKGVGHIVALGIALSIAFAGLLRALWVRGGSQGGAAPLSRADREQATAFLLAEVVALEKAKRKKLIGSKAYEQTRQALLVALARLETDPAGTNTTTTAPGA